MEALEGRGEGREERGRGASLLLTQSVSLARSLSPFLSLTTQTQALGLGSEISTRGVWAGAAELGLGLLLGCSAAGLLAGGLDWTGLACWLRLARCCGGLSYLSARSAGAGTVAGAGACACVSVGFALFLEMR